jgi:pimeloyl-ACP methyl ester carboxylesterase
LRAPERVRGVVGMSVPYQPRADRPPLETWASELAGVWFYILYFQEPGVADLDLGRDPATTMRRVLSAFSGDAPDEVLASTVGPADGRGLVDRLPDREALPGWLTQVDLDHYAGVFAGTGFTGGLNWYRNFDRNWWLTQDYAGAKVRVPAMFVAGARDPVLTMIPPDDLPMWVEDLRGVTVLPDTGHWVQQERPQQVNAVLLDFLGGLAGPSVSG